MVLSRASSYTDVSVHSTFASRYVRASLPRCVPSSYVHGRIMDGWMMRAAGLAEEGSVGGREQLVVRSFQRMSRRTKEHNCDNRGGSVHRARRGESTRATGEQRPQRQPGKRRTGPDRSHAKATATGMCA